LKEPDLRRILEKKRNRLAAVRRWPGQPPERDELASVRSTRRVRSWYLREEWLLLTSAAVSVMVFFVGFMVSVHFFAGGSPWPAQPVISAQAPSSASPFDSVFYVANPSAFFAIHNLSVGCRVMSIGAKRLSSTQDPKDSLMFPALGLKPLVEAASTNAFTCPFREHLEMVAGADLLNDAREARIMLMAKYDAPWWYPLSPQVSTLFTLNTRRSPPQWIVAIRRNDL
jgi:hypothetical protein